MKDLITSLYESTDIEVVNVVCVKDYQTKHLTFKKGETFTSRKINQNWWCIDGIGITEKAFKTYFKKNPR